MDPSTERREHPAAIRTFLIADVRGYTRFTAQHGDEAASRLAAGSPRSRARGSRPGAASSSSCAATRPSRSSTPPAQALRAAVELAVGVRRRDARPSPALPLRRRDRPRRRGGRAGRRRLPRGGAQPRRPAVRDRRPRARSSPARACPPRRPGGRPRVPARRAGHLQGLRRADRRGQRVRAWRRRPADESAMARTTRRASVAPAPPCRRCRPSSTRSCPSPAVSAELRWLAWHWRRARHGHGRTVVLSGPPGHRQDPPRRRARDASPTTVARPSSTSRRPAWPTDARTDGADSPTDRPGPHHRRRPRRRGRRRRGRRSSSGARRLAGRPGDVPRHPPPRGPARAHRPRRAARPARAAPHTRPASTRTRCAPSSPSTPAAPWRRRRIDDLLGESGGVPAAVHRVASHWARTSAAGRLGSSAERTDAGRRGLRDAEAALVGDVADLELARERERLLRGRSRRARAGVAAGSRTVCPYKGLAEFEAADADYYFGRERLVAELIARFVGGSFLGLVGDSGSGKSSALRAGLLPALAGGVLPGSDSWPQAIFRPGEHPLAELRRALARALPEATLPAGDAAAALDAALAGLATGAAPRPRRRPVRGGLQRDPRRRRAERLHRPAHRRAPRPEGHRRDAGRPLRPLRGLPGARAARSAPTRSSSVRCRAPSSPRSSSIPRSGSGCGSSPS